MASVQVPDGAKLAADEAFTKVARKLSGQPWFTADVNAVMAEAALTAINAAAPLIVAADRQHLADSLRDRLQHLERQQIPVSQDAWEIVEDLDRMAKRVGAPEQPPPFPKITELEET